jgi:hypothetical protein
MLIQVVLLSVNDPPDSHIFQDWIMFKILPSRNNTEPANSDEYIEKNWWCNRVLTKYRRGSGLLRIEEASPTYLQLSLNPMPTKKEETTSGHVS